MVKRSKRAAGKPKAPVPGKAAGQEQNAIPQAAAAAAAGAEAPGSKVKEQSVLARDRARDKKNPPAVKTAAKKSQENADFVSSPVNTMLWLLSLILVCGAIFGNYYYTKYILIDESGLQRLARVGIVIGVIVIGLAVLLFTNKGHRLLKFASQSYTELLKVVWPTRQEAVQTTFVVFVAVSLVSLLLYLCDIAFLQLVRLITL